MSCSVDGAEFGKQLFVIRQLLPYQVPEFFAVVKMCQVTKLMHNNIVGEMWWEELNFVVEVEIFVGRTTPPTATLIANRDSVPREIVVLVEVREARERKLARRLLVRHVMLRHGCRPLSINPFLSSLKKHLYEFKYVMVS
ncbi:MAG: hypothetical protein RL538_637 [Candidatus Parcubacteria bacterium]|jgi:hypothetical protein